ncbi:MAG: hypothetical protein ACJ8F7_09875 [Gemmataceae bacterium]
MPVAALAMLPAMWSLFIVPVSPSTVPPPRSSDRFLASMRETPFAETPRLPAEVPQLSATQPSDPLAMLSRDPGSLFPDASRELVLEDWGALGFSSNGPRRSLGRQVDIEGLKLNSKVVLADPDWHVNTPIRRTGWKTEESVKLPFLGPLFVVGQVGANSGSVEQQQFQLVGKTGVGMKLPSWLGGEIQFRTGRSKTNYDTDTDTLLSAEQVKTFVEVATRWPLAGWLNLEYTGQARPPALSPIEHDTLKVEQDVRLAMPFSNSGQFHIGARYKWEDTTMPTPWMDRMKWYFGLEFKR